MRKAYLVLLVLCSVFGLYLAKAYAMGVNHVGCSGGSDYYEFYVQPGETYPQYQGCTGSGNPYCLTTYLGTGQQNVACETNSYPTDCYYSWTAANGAPAGVHLAPSVCP